MERNVPNKLIGIDLEEPIDPDDASHQSQMVQDRKELPQLLNLDDASHQSQMVQDRKEVTQPVDPDDALHQPQFLQDRNEVSRTVDPGDASHQHQLEDGNIVPLPVNPMEDDETDSDVYAVCILTF